jgi:putative phosphoribosyl transferase
MSGASTPIMATLPKTIEVSIATAGVDLGGRLSVPSAARGVIVFAHRNGMTRHSPQGRQIARALRARGFGTLLFDLLTPAEDSIEEIDSCIRFDIEALARRLIGVTEWVRADPRGEDLPIGYLGAGTGAAAALVAAACRPGLVDALVSYGGRPDLAGRRLSSVDVPTLLVVGGADPAALALHRAALQLLRCPVQIEILPGASDLFRQSNLLIDVARLAERWFATHLGRVVHGPRRWLGDHLC